MAARICIVDYQKGNLASVERGLADAGYAVVVSADPEDIRRADGLVLPGVGSFYDAMTTLNETGQAQALREEVRAGKPFLGICLGLHLAFSWGDEGCEPQGRIEGLGLVPGHIERMPALTAEGRKLKVPHVGWNSVALRPSANRLFAGVPDNSYFYFTHSYIALCDDEADVAGVTEHARPFASAVAHDNVFATQFHPEKSSTLGLRVLANFGRMVEEGIR